MTNNNSNNVNGGCGLANSNVFHQMPPGDKIPEEINIIIEISKGSRVKYEMCKKYGMIQVDRILHTPIPYPFSYGLIPQTWNDYDHDPLDAIVIASEPLIPGCFIQCRTIGMLSVDDDGERDDKILAVPLNDPYCSHIKAFDEVSKKEREDIQYFLEHYKDLEKKTVTVKSWDDAEAAKEFIAECVECYKKKEF